ncbi:MAG: NAD(P)H-hydrate dehydratase [Fimbriimonas sp.]
MRIATADQMRRIDRRAIEEFGIPSRVLMERAGYAVFQKIQEILPDGGSIAVVCGKGNNGGDGLVIARLANEAGYFVDCLVASPEANSRSEELLHALRTAGVTPTFADSEYWVPRLQALASHDLIVDALLGTGAKGEVKGDIANAIHAINQAGTLVLAVDVPSGIDCDTGTTLGAAVVADVTVTFGLAKPFLFCNDGLECSGDWSIAEIGFPSQLLDNPTGATLIDHRWVGEKLPVRTLGSHKGNNGHVLILAGSNRMRGAAVLCAKAALRSGAGLLTVAGPEEVCAAVAFQLPEALLLPDPTIKELTNHRADVGLFGPGLTHDEAIRHLLLNLFEQWDRPAVVDADALNSVAIDKKLPKGPCVLTPHPGEMGRLLESSAADVEANRFAAAEQAVERFGQTVLLKGRHSIVASPGQDLVVNSTGNSGLATGGSGDVLAGIIASLMAQGIDPYEAAACGMFWHGLAADLCVQEIGSIGYSPSEVAQALPKARDTIIEKCNSDL